ncbi:MAG: hypothetical protein DIZ80_08400 [endosymbiont of Galathealinum brachiosum]|uniref:HMA domain-containing protein n=1 Tax=endosymbiont of Galathealinum brachiosum TaxID=2200906 RepID=A0A370DBR1_9GAMM|nr:MAG: hypothetical protein DIZ80_08400 [endosymbiont of Galathealinum brachiosum]
MSEQHYFRINGLNDESCVLKIEKALQAKSGVESFEIDFESEMAFIKSELSAEEISRVIDKEGYNAILIPE